MQIFVNRADLTAATPPSPLVVLATYTDDPTVPYSAHGGTSVTVIYLNATLVLMQDLTLPGGITVPQKVLDPNWRASADGIVNAEANRRITDVFPEFKQRNSNATYQQCITAYGNNPGVWPTPAATFKIEYDRGWNYVNAVRQNTPPLIATLPPDPTADQYWPTRITPVSFAPVF